MKEMKEKEETSLAGSTKQQLGNVVEFAWWLKKRGYSDETIRGDSSILQILQRRGAELCNPEAVRDVIARQKWSPNRRRNAINAYTLYLKMHDRTWEKPRCVVTQKIPFVPTEAELDSLIAGCGKKTSAFLQTLKETGMRAGEAKALEWTDVSFEKRLITLNRPEKSSNARIWKVSQKLLGMLDNLPRDKERIFGDGPLASTKSTFTKARKRLAKQLQNQQLLKISFHTFRHWKATMEYHRTKDPYYVKNLLGHKSLRSTEIYITVERTIFQSNDDEFAVRVATKPEEIKSLLECGFEFVCQKDELMFFRKRK
jgi:integrase